MIRTLWHLSHSRRFALVLAASLFILLGAARAATPGQRDFATPADAATSLVDAARAGDQKALLAVLGPTARNLVVSGDPVQDRNALTRFITAYDAKHTLEARGPDRVDLVVGQENWPLPIPIVQSAGRWRFDSAAGADELVDRRIGKNELLTIKTLLASTAAQQDYFERLKAGTGAGAYAQRMLSTPGRTDGLYWEVEPGQPPSPLGPLVDEARNEGYPGAVAADGKPIPYHGYFFRILKAQGPDGPGGAKNYVRNGQLTGGFALLAWPAEYARSGVVTFIVGPDGVVYQKDLGPSTARSAAAIKRFDPDLTWARIDIAK
jgi:hypothetical protein